MLETGLLIAPIFTLLLLGNLIKKVAIHNEQFWRLKDKLIYWLLLPSLFFNKVSTAKFNFSNITDYFVILIVIFFSLVFVALLIGILFRFDPKTKTSVLQGSVRHNSFIALAIVAELYGNQGIVYATMIMVVLIPMTNLSIVTLMVLLLHSGGKGIKQIGNSIIKNLFANPLLISIFLGLVCANYELNNIPIVHDVTGILSGATLPLALLVVGASIKIKLINSDLLPILSSAVIKLLLFPLLVLLFAQYFYLSTIQTTVLLIFAAVPTAVSSYSLAQQMGGNAKLMGSIISVETFLAFFTLPLVLSLAK